MRARAVGRPDLGGSGNKPAGALHSFTSRLDREGLSRLVVCGQPCVKAATSARSLPCPCAGRSARAMAVLAILPPKSGGVSPP